MNWEWIQHFFRNDHVLIYRTLILYILSLFTIRLLGKRVVGNISPFDLLLTIIIGSSIAVPMENENIPLSHGIIPIIIILLINYLINYIIIKNRTLEDFLQGTSRVLIMNGEVKLKNLQKERISLADLILLLREKDVSSIDEVEEAILEPNGQISVVKRKGARNLTADDLVELMPVGRSNYDSWLQESLSPKGQSNLVRAENLEEEWKINLNLLLDAIALGFNDQEIARIMKQPVEKISGIRDALNLTGKQVGLSLINKNKYISNLRE